MKFGPRIIIAAIILISLAGPLGCSSRPNNTAAANMMQLIYRDLVPFEFFDVNAIRNDTDLAELWVYIQSEVYLDDSIESFGIAGDRTLIYQVTDVSQKMAAVKQASTSSYQYDNFTVWEMDSYISVVQIDNYIIMGKDSDIRDFIFVDNNKDKGPSLYDNEYYRAIIDRLPSGYMLEFGGMSEWYHYIGGLADGMSVVNEGTNQICTYIVKIRDDYAEYLRTEENATIPLDCYVTSLETIDYLDYESINDDGGIKPPPWWNE